MPAFMNWDEWADLKPLEMLSWLCDGTEAWQALHRPSDRKLRLLAVAVERIWLHRMGQPDRHADSLAQAVAWADSGEPPENPLRGRGSRRWWWLYDDAFDAARRSLRTHDVASHRPLWAEVLRDLVPAPFLLPPVVLPGWRTPLVRDLAQAAYESVAGGRLDPVRLAVLADALEDGDGATEPCPHCAGRRGFVRDSGGSEPWGQPIDLWDGCETCGGTGSVVLELVRHLRGPEPHVPGCWAVDLVRGEG